MNEEWVPVPGFSLYDVSTEGRIRSVDYFAKGKIVVLNPSRRHEGRQVSLLPDEGKRRTMYLHKLVAITFLGKRPKTHYLVSIDGNKQNSNPRNLEYIPYSKYVHLPSIRWDGEIPEYDI